MKKRVIFWIVLLAVVIIGTAIFIFAFRQNRPQVTNSNIASNTTICIKEGKESYGEAMVVYPCCSGLSEISAIDDKGVMTYDVGYCTKCGDSKCKKPENKYNCPADCQ